MTLRKRLLLGAALFLALLLALPFLLPLGVFIPEIELAASEKLKASVHIGTLRLFVLPYPHLAATGISVGRGKPFLEIERAVVTPRLESLFDEQKVIREISLQGVVVAQALLPRAAALANAPAPAGPAKVRVERVELHDAFINLKDLKLRNLDLGLELTPQGGLDHAQVHADEGRFSASLQPRGKAFAVEIAAHDWKLPAGPPLLVSNLAASGHLDPQKGLALSAIDASLYGGTVTGQLDVAWAPQWTVAGKLDIRGVEIRPVVALFTSGTTISGKLSANPVLGMRAATAAALGDSIDIESDFKVENGVLYDFDLAKAPRALLDKEALKGGQTRFDKLAGHLGVDAQGYYLSGVEIASGVLSADAQVNITSRQELSGQIDVALKGTSALVSTPLALSGTLQEPRIHPSKAALAGAAAGTALLGPGLGTTVGMKAARLTQRMFGGKPARKKPPAQDAMQAAPEGAQAPPKRTPSVMDSGR